MARISRRGFLGGATALGMYAAFGRMPAPKTRPIMRLGVMTDTHVGKTVESCEHVRMALRLFKAKGAELVINNGDIADLHYPTGYRAYRQVFNEVYADGAKPKEIYAYAAHDTFYWKDHPREQAWEDGADAFEDVRRLLEAPNAHTDTIRHKGYTFLVFPQYTGGRGLLSWKEYEERIARACAENPGKPVFVVDHVPPMGTVYNSHNWGSRRAREIMNRYPQVVDLSGHVHGSLRNDGFIWQKEFTVINAGCLQVWYGLLTANTPTFKRAYGVLTIDVHKDRLVVRRWDVRDQTEIEPDRPWVVPLPFVAENAPYLPSRRRAAEPRPRFARTDRLEVVAEGTPFKGFRLRFPEVARNTMLYRLAAQGKGKDGQWETFAWCEMFSDFWKSPKERTGKAEFLFREAFFEPSTAYRLEVTPVNQYGVLGTPLRAVAKSPATFAKAEVVFESANPAVEFGCCRGDKTLKPYSPDAEGFYELGNDGLNYLKLPAGAFAGPKGAKFRLALDIRTIQPDEGSTWILKLRDPTTGTDASSRISTPNGDSGSQRYILDLEKSERNGADTYCVCFERGPKGRVKFDGAKLVRC